MSKMDEIKLSLKSGEEILLDFNNFTEWEYSLNDFAIRPNTKLIDSSNDEYIVERIFLEYVILKDSSNILYSIPKEEIINYKRVIQMDSTLNKNFATFCMYLGTGNINSKIWFVGIEEGGDAVTEQDLKKELIVCEKESQFVEDASCPTPVWNLISNLLHEKYQTVHNLGKSDYRKKMFSKDYSYFFLTELFPLPKPNTSSWSDDYVNIFGYNKNDYDKYLSDVRSFRFPMIYKKWNEVKPDITICFGSTYWNEYINLFKLGHSKFVSLSRTNLINFPSEKIILSPFFNYRTIKDNDIKALKNLINEIKS